MKAANCKPGDHLWTMYSYHPEEALEVEDDLRFNNKRLSELNGLKAVLEGSMR